jgi:ATP-dependent Zn protease
VNSRERAEKLRAAAVKFKHALHDYLDAVQDVRLTLNRRGAEAALARGPTTFLAYCSLVRALKSVPGLFTPDSSVVVVTIPQTWSLEVMADACELCFGIERHRPSYFNVFSHPSGRNKKGTWDFQPSKELSYQKVIVFAGRGTELHPEVEAAADTVLHLDLMLHAHVNALARLLKTEAPPSDDFEYLRHLPYSYIDYIFRRGRPTAPAVLRVRKTIERQKAGPKVLPLRVFGKAEGWAKILRDDLEQWRNGQLLWAEIDKGLLLYGPPGTGKTSFASSLAAHLNLPLIATSLGRWQSAGHLGDLLRSMYADFSRATNAAPAILFIDELDSIGDRGKFTGDSQHYCTEVVNALLEAIDGSLAREGVIVVGASNHPGKIDPALLRPGRLERHFKLEKPGLKEREQMLEYYLPGLDELSLNLAAVRLDGATGADIEFFARRVRQRSRSEGSPTTAAHLAAELPPAAVFDDQDRWRICVHEAGHAVLVKLLHIGRIISIRATIDGLPFDQVSVDAYGRVDVERPRRLIENETGIRNEIAMSLGGMAAEELIIGDRSTTAGGTEGSDLGSATFHAARMILRFGLGGALPIVPNININVVDTETYKNHPFLRQEINEVLQIEYQRAKRILKDNERVVQSLAKALEQTGILEEGEIENLIGTVAVATAPTAEVSKSSAIQVGHCT